MGTVGLSFGSPTSGAGFDVSSTVSQIVGNLQNIETPWKTQLADLQSQDTAISSLGTLFSNLSNDLSALTDFQGIMAQKTGSSSDPNVLTLTAANSSAVAGTHSVQVTNLATTASGYLAAISNVSDTLTGSITLQVGTTGKTTTVSLPSSGGTLASLAKAINASGAGISASVLTDSSGSRLSLVSGTSGAAGNITVSGSSIVDTSALLGYSGTAGTATQNSTGTLHSIANAGDTLSGSISIQVGTGTAQTVAISSSDNTLSGLAAAINTAAIGVTASVVTNSDGTSSLSLLSQTAGTAGTLTVNSSVLDTTEALGYNPTVTGVDANLTVDGINLTSSSNTVANLIPGVTFQLLAPSAKESDGSLEQVQVIIGNDNTGVESTFNSMVSDYNALITAMNAQEGHDTSGNAQPLFGSPTLSLLQQQLLGGVDLQNPNGNLDSISTNTNTTLTGSMSIAVGTGTAETIVIGAAPSTPAANTIYTGSGANTLADLETAINSANLGVTAAIITSGTQSTLSLRSQTAGTAGDLTVSSSLVASSDALLGSLETTPSSTQNANATIFGIQNANDILSGSFTVQVGSGTTQTVTIDSTNNTLATLATSINNAAIGVTASVVTNSDGSASLSLLSQTAGTPGTLTVTTNMLDTTDVSTKSLNYTSSSDISALTNLGISVNNNGSVAFNVATLDSALNSDYSGVVGFFQGLDSWGQTFSTILNNAGTGSPSGVLALAGNSNSSIESTLNADISRENTYISAQQVSLTAELNSANEIMQQLPTQLQGVNELYSAVTGYNQNHG